MKAQCSMQRVALLVDLSAGYGQGVLKGAANFVRMQRQWSIYLAHRDLIDLSCHRFKNWAGHGVIMQVRNKWTAKVVSELRVPAVDAQHQFPNLHFPTVIP